MPRGKPGNPYIYRDPLAEAGEAAKASVKNLVGFTMNDQSAQRLAERVVRVYLNARGDNSFKTRLKESTIQMYQMEVGEILEVEASCRANLHGQFKTIRQKTGNEQMKWKCEQVSAGLWRIERRPDGSYCRTKRPEHNPKAKFLAEIPVGKWAQYPQVKSCNSINVDFTKNKARQILKDAQADWRGRTRNGVVEIMRLR